MKTNNKVVILMLENIKNLLIDLYPRIEQNSERAAEIKSLQQEVERLQRAIKVEK